jgi:hypothetical protein
VDGESYTAVGVMPQEFRFQFWSNLRQLWGPVGYTEGDKGRGSHSFVAIARLKPGVTVAQAPGASYSVTCPAYFRTLDIPLLEGREFTDKDTGDAPGVIVINQTMACRYWPKEDPVGKRIKIGYFDSHDPWLTVVGVLGDVRHWGLDREVRPEFFLPLVPSESVPKTRAIYQRAIAGRPATLF